MPERDGGPSGPRPFWSGALTFGLVSVPVRLYPATRGGRESLRMVDEEGTPLTRRWVCPKEEKVLSRDEIVRGYEVDEGEWVVVTEEELEALEPEKSREIDLRRFVPVEQLDPVFFRRAYFLAPADGGAKAYRLLAAVMEEDGRAGVATFVMRGHEYLVAILAREGILRAETMRFHDEIRSPADVGLEDVPKVDEARVAALVKAIEEAREESLDRSELEDEEAAALEALVRRKKREGEDVVAVPEGSRTEDPGGDTRVVDLLEVLKRSLAEDDGPAPAAPVADLESRTKAELYERAKELDIPGRSDMTKAELVEALRGSAA